MDVDVRERVNVGVEESKSEYEIKESRFLATGDEKTTKKVRILHWGYSYCMKGGCVGTVGLALEAKQAGVLAQSS